MRSVCEITTPSCQAIVRFDDQKQADVERVEDILTELADEGLVYGVEFHQEQ